MTYIHKEYIVLIAIIVIFCLLNKAFSQDSQLQNANILYKNGDYKSAKDIYLQNINKAEACYMLGVLYLKGQGVNKDYTKAIDYLKKAIKQKYPKAIYLLGYMYEQGLGVKQDHSKAIGLYQQVSYAKDLGKINIQGNLVPLKKVGIPEAQHNLATLFLKGNGISKNISEAFKLYHLAAEQGFAESEYTLGILYYKGIGCKKNLSKSIDYFQKAAEKGIVNAQYNLATIYLDENNWKESEKWYLKAAQNNLPIAQNELAWYWSEKGIKPNESLDWSRKAVDSSPKNANFVDTLGWILYKQEKYDEALEQLKKASKLEPNDDMIHYHLGEAYKAVGKKKEAKEQWNKALELTKDEELKKKLEEKLKTIK